jgi:hypothetical protein
VKAKPPFDALWNADAAVLAEFFPAEGEPFDHSSADLSLMSLLAFATGRDAPRMERIFGRSALAQRDKWKRADYRRRTIAKACAGCVSVYNEGHRDEARRAEQIAEAKRIGADLDEPPLPVVMTLDDMIRDLVLVDGEGGVIHRPTKRLRRSIRGAQLEYAASRHTWTDENGKAKEAPALALWLKHPQRMSVDAITWAPGQAEFCRPPEGSDAGERAFNLWRGLRPFTPPEDWRERARPFVDHVAYLVPVDAERTRFLQWLAHIVQRPGELPHTAYLHLTPTRGIGRNWLTGVLARVLRGYVAAGVTLGDVLDGGFNGRLSRKLLATVDETREGLSARRYERANALQRIVTEEVRLINPKYGLQRVEVNCCRWLMLSNFEDALPFDNADRRVIVIANPTDRQSADYYAALYARLNDAAFLASVWEYLATLDLEGFNPGAHAPLNAAKITAIESMASELDRIVSEFAAAWPGNLCGRDNVRRYARTCLGGAAPDERHLSHAIERAGMTSTGKRVRMFAGLDRVVIVRGHTRERVMDAEPAALRAEIEDAAVRFTLGE